MFVPVGHGEVQIDAADLSKIQSLRWTVHRYSNDSKNPIFYATATIKGRTVYMHRWLVGAKRGDEVDHWNNDGLDNRRDNLRVITHKLNLANQRPQVGRSSQFKGVSYYTSRGTWEAYIKRDGITRRLGYFQSEVAAALAYDAAALGEWGEYARVNFPGHATMPSPVDWTVVKRTPSSSTTGVGWNKRTQRWEAYISVNAKNRHLGLYKTEEEAIAARRQGELDKKNGLMG